MRSKIVTHSAFCLILISGITSPIAGQTVSSQAEIVPRIVSAIDNSVRVRIAHSTHPLAQSRYDAGPLEGNTPLQRMIMLLAPSPDQEQQLQSFLDSQQTKGSPDYHRWLTPDEFGARFGPSQQDIQQVTGWLHQQGFIVSEVARSGRWIEFSGTVRQVQAAFQTQMRQYQILGKMHLGNSTDISIPQALSPVVGGVLSLHNFFKKPMRTRTFQVHRNQQGLLAPVGPDVTVKNKNGTFHFLAPGDFAKIYDLNPLYNSGLNGTNQTIAIVARSNIRFSDIELFRGIFHVPGVDPIVTINGQDPGEDLFFGDGIEATLDAEWSRAVAPRAAINVVVSGSTLITDGVDLSAAFIVENNLAQVMSVSFGDCEKALPVQENSFWNALWQQAAAQGISVFVAAGDDGAAGCDDPNPNTVPASGGQAVSGIASTPFNTAVGGTEFNENGQDATFWNATNSTTDFSSVVGYIPEMVWNESCSPMQVNTGCAGQNFFELFAGSGGVSTLYSKPSWQSTSIPGVPNDGKRDLPDVSLTAAGHDGYLICFETGDPTFELNCVSSTDINGNPVLLNAGVVGGTSASSPAFAGIMAIVDQKIGGRQGLPNYVLYSLAGAENFSNCNSSNRTNPGAGTACVFNDITVGNNNVPGQVGFNATLGFDLASGLGSVDANNLVTQWGNLAKGFQASQTTLTAAVNGNPVGSIGINHGQSVTLTGQVQKSPSGAGPTGNIAFVTDKAGPQGGAVTVGAGALSGSPASFSAPFNNLPGGTYNLSAHYPGDGTFAASDSAGIPVTVAKENSSTSLTVTLFNVNTGPVPLAPVPYGDVNNILVFDGTVAGSSGAGFPSGTISFADGGNAIASVPMNNRAQGEVANCFTPVTCLTIGTHNITASYPSGDDSFNPGGPSSAVSITIVKGNPFVIITSGATLSGGVPVPISALVLPGLGVIAPTGTLQFFDGTAALGAPVPVSTVQTTEAAGTAQVTFNSQGTHSVTAHYSGDSTYNAATSQATNVTITSPFGLTGVLGVTSAVIQAGGIANYSLGVNQNAGFTGAVSFNCTGAPAGVTCTVNPAVVNLTGGGALVTAMVTTTTSARLERMPFRSWSPAFAAVFGILVCGVSRKRRHTVLMVLGICLILGVNACGGGGGTPPPRPPTVATLTVTGTSGAFSSSINLSLTITH